MILGLDRGLSVAEVARGAGCHRDTVYYWLRAYMEYRDVKRLSGVDPTWGRENPAASASAVNALGPTPGRAEGTLGAEARAALEHESRTLPEPRRRLRAAVAWALERGVAPTRVAKASGMSRQAGHKAWRALAARAEGGP